MAMQLGVGDDDDDALNTTINTTPLVDVMLVLLIIFLITIPVVTHTIPVDLPKTTDQPRVTRPQNIALAVSADGAVYWGQQRISDTTLRQRLAAAARLQPSPKVEIRGDQAARYAAIGELVDLCQQAGLSSVNFIVQPPSR